MSRFEIFQPICVKNFKCIGNKCEDSCCKEWNITIDKDTYLKYKSIEDDEIKKIVNKRIKLNKKEKDEKVKEVSYAYFVLDKNRRCPFWEKDELCLLHKKLGHESLCSTCSEFPRSKKILNNVLNYTLSPSCPEAARLILGNQDGLVFEKSELDGELPNNVINIKSTNLTIIKEFSIELMQYREINIEKRLILLASLFDDINNDKQQIENIVNNYKKMIETKDFKIEIKEDLKSKNIQFSLYKEINKIKKKGTFTSSYLKYLNEISESLNIKNKDKAFEKYKYIKENKYDNFLNKYEYIIENYLVNRMFLNEFPYSKTISLSDKCKELLIIYALLKSTIIGYLSYNETPTEAEIISLIQSFVANIDHKENLFSECLKNALLKVTIIDLFKQRKNSNENQNSNDIALQLLNIALSTEDKLPFDTVTEVIYFFI